MAILCDLHSVVGAVIEAGQKKCKTAREQLEAIESHKKSVNRKRKQLVASASEPRNKKQGVPVQELLIMWQAQL